jgi:hypothetical protein
MGVINDQSPEYSPEMAPQTPKSLNDLIFSVFFLVTRCI